VQPFPWVSEEVRMLASRPAQKSERRDGGAGERSSPAFVASVPG
jgi:hypothetical protein